jgi:hypothetical protein
MVKSLTDAADKWERKTSNVGQKWKENTLKGDYCKGFSDFVGHQVKDACDNWRREVEAVSPSTFNAAISGKKQKYIDGLRNVK